ncbi:MAG: hypothetical protein VW577_04040 [Pelagibacteraceae bacterium]
MNDIVKITPENLEVANAYLSTGSALVAASQLGVEPNRIYEILEKSEVKQYMNSVYLDQGYRNRFRLAELLDEVIEKKLEEARETDIYSTKDLADLITLAHKISQDHSKTTTQTTQIKHQNNVQINSPFGDGNYGKLMEKLLGSEGD